MRVLICDDQKTSCEEAEAASREAFPEASFDKRYLDELQKSLEGLFSAVDATLDGKTDTKSPFDGYDVIVIDNNLSHLGIKGARITAESIAGYVRGFSDSPYVVSLNRNPNIDFDLRYLMGDFSTRTDLALNTPHLANKALWTGRAGDATQGFAPWYWPSLRSAGERRRKQIEFVRQNLDSPILPKLGFDAAAVSALSRHAKGSLSPEAEQPGASAKDTGHPLTEITFRKFFETSPRSLPAQDDRIILRDKKMDETIARIVAAEIDCWLRRDVYAPQDVLVDVPHLLARMPFLLGEQANDIQAWNASIETDAAPFGLNAEIYERHIKRFAASMEEWAEGPMFWWQGLKANEELNKLFFEKGEWGDFVFCEDTRKFMARMNADGTGPREFVAEFESPWDRRYVALLPGRTYAPRSRLAL